jgi:hypothetical protein
MTDFLGRGQLLNRLAQQTGNRDMAKQILIDRGHMREDGTLTPAGKKRDNMTAAERAIERASKESGKPAKRFIYNPKTNRAKLKRR